MDGKLSCLINVEPLEGGGFLAFSPDLGNESVVWGESLEEVRREAGRRVRAIIGYPREGLAGRGAGAERVEVEFGHPELGTIAR
ncbi:hypothetical protein BH23VER1_BH23VER1_07260 [soil metagenome]